MSLFKKLFKKHKKSNFWDKYKGYNPVRSIGGLTSHIEWIKTYTNISVHTIMEIGANFAQDADYLCEKFNCNAENVWVFEAHPDIYNAIKKIHPKFNAFNYAVYNCEKEMNFNFYPLEKIENTGVSSLLTIPKYISDKRGGVKTQTCTVQAIRMDNFLNTHNISSIDFLKLDVEGVNYEVLEGFGKRIKDICAIHTESEIMDNTAYVNQKENFSKIQKLLQENNFEMVFFQKYYDQADSFWVRKDLLKKFYTNERK